MVDFNVADKQLSVVKKLKGESAESKRYIQKEAGILNSVKGHRNISWYKNETNKLFGFVCFSEYIFLQIHVQVQFSPVHILQMQSMFYKSNPVYVLQYARLHTQRKYDARRTRVRCLIILPNILPALR